MAEVRVFGAGVAGLMVARGLRAAGVDTVVVDPRGTFGGASGRSLGLVLPCHAEHPHRTLAALGGQARELSSFYQSVRLPGFRPMPVRWVAAPFEEPGLHASLEGAISLGLPCEPADGGYRMGGGGLVDLALLRSVLAEIPVLPRDETPVEVEVYTTGPDVVLEPWLADKLMPVRLQGARFSGVPAAEPLVSAGTMLRIAGDAATGGRAATPHFEVGETEERLEPRVSAMLARNVRSLAPGLTAVEAEWAGIVAEPCDGLPLVGPVPGRPRSLVLAGLSVNGLAAVAACAEALVIGLTRGEQRLPACLRTARM